MSSQHHRATASRGRFIDPFLHALLIAHHEPIALIRSGHGGIPALAHASVSAVFFFPNME